MPQSFVQNYLHIVFATQKRQPILTGEISIRLYPYLAGICTNLESPPVQIGGYLDHIHIMCRLSKNIALKDFIRVLKANSSKWVKGFGEAFSRFEWQEGYGAFSVSPDRVEVVKRYILSQNDHHKTKTFEQEYQELLRIAGIEIDQKYGLE